jgi:sec-independent protein translocase protein TatA
MGYFQTPWHIVLLLLIALMLFGGRRLPEMGRALGSGMREFKDASLATRTLSKRNSRDPSRGNLHPSSPQPQRPPRRRSTRPAPERQSD